MSAKPKKRSTTVVPLRPEPEDQDQLHAVVDGEVVKIEGAERVEIRCGKACIILTKDGKIILEGKYISSEASGAHRIRGGSVDIN